MRTFHAPALLLLAALLAPTGSSTTEERPAEKPKVRALTAFIKLDTAQYQEQIQQTLAFLRQAKGVYEQAGFEVQTIRITTQPFPEYTRGMAPLDALHFFHQYDELAMKEGFAASIGPAMLKPGDNPEQAVLLSRILAPATTIAGSIVIAGEDGVHWDAVKMAAGMINFLAEHSPKSLANFRFAATALVPPGTPFYPASYHLDMDHKFSVGLQSANVVAEAMSATHDPAAAEQRIRETLGAYAKQIETVSNRVAEQANWGYMGIDLSPAPLKRVSIGGAIESFTGGWMGSSGTLTAAAVITRAIQSIPVTRIGYSGLMMPVLEDSVIAQRWSEGALSMDGLLAYSSVCGTGLDVVPLPGKISAGQLERILADVATLSVKLHKPLSARLLPVAGKDAGDKTEFADPFLVNAMIRPLP
jgi:uncharacterized protein (UPF0210 family)